MIDMAKRQMLPPSVEYAAKLASSITSIKSAVPCANTSAQEDMVKELSTAAAKFKKCIVQLEEDIKNAGELEGDSLVKASYYRDVVFKDMGELRRYDDKLESLVDSKLWPLPTYVDMLFSI